MSTQTELNLPVRKTRSSLRKSTIISYSEAEDIINAMEKKSSRRSRKPSLVSEEISKKSEPKTPTKRGIKKITEESNNEKDIQCSSPKRSPVKEAVENSDKMKKENVSPRKNLFNSPVKKVISQNESPVKRMPLSPIKSHNSPAKNMGSPALRSPMKKLQISPTKKTQSPMKSNKSPSKITLTKSNASMFTKAKHSLHTQLTDCIVGRDDEIKSLNNMIEPYLKKKIAHSVYISGAPGTGKTISVTYILDKLSKNIKFKSVFINCMTLRTASAIYKRINEGLNFKGDSLDAIHDGVKKTQCVIVLDEVDQLQSQNQQILYSLFELAKLNDSKVVLVGIANALDLTDKTVPLLQAYGCRPELFHFAPYSDKQIVNILKSRLAECNTVIKPAALMFCAKKIASCTGDVRKALDICRRAVEIVERQVRQQRILAARDSENSPAVAQPMVVDLKHISQVLSDIFNTRARGNQDLHSTLPLQQKLLLCAILVYIKKTKQRDLTLGKLHEVYTKICRIAKVAAIDYSELQSICTLLEARALVTIKRAKENRQSKVSLSIDENEVEQVLQDKNILAMCLQETIC